MTRLCPEAWALLKGRRVGRRIPALLANMMPERQVETCRAMLEMNDVSLANAIAFLAATPPPLLDGEFLAKCCVARSGLGAQLVAGVGAQMDSVEKAYGIATLQVAAAKLFVKKIRANAPVAAYIRSTHAAAWRQLESATASNQPKRRRGGGRWHTS